MTDAETAPQTRRTPDDIQPPPQRHHAITSDRVEGTAVYTEDGDHMGHVHSLVIEKADGKVTDIVVSIGGFLGLGGELHSIPWEKFAYDVNLAGYRLGLSKQELRDAPTFTDESRELALDMAYQQRVYDYYSVAPYWY
ncbi:MAG: photosystem reaction center subunit H [Sphingorhabdus sp.]|nr:photosystem reaction center subunit H [Sphingorhabdus sp.]|tara:strand:+ start:1311 stop:1724 length:414 start_codon:yes stop_codon:yes gene_type:complete